MIPLDDADLALLDVAIIELKAAQAEFSVTERKMFASLLQLNEIVREQREEIRDLEFDIERLQDEKHTLEEQCAELQDELDECS